MVIFFSIVSVFLGIIWWTVWWEIFYPISQVEVLRYPVLVLFWGSLLFQVYRFSQFRKGDPHPSLVLATFVLFGYFIHLFCAALTKAFIFQFISVPWSEIQVAVVFLLIASFFNAMGILTALRGPYVERVKIPVPEEYRNIRGFRLAQISDLHLGPLIKSTYVEKIANLLRDHHLDAMVYTGDIGDGDAKYFAKELLPLSSLPTRLGHFYVTGNHENMWNPSEWIEHFSQQGLRPLLNRGVQLHEELYLAGVPDISSKSFGFGMVSSPQQAVQSGRGFKVLLAHQPKSCFAAQDAGFDLMLSGHTHNGQFFPFNLLVGFFNPYSKGLNLHKNMMVYVNSGTGFWGPPLRLGVRSEVTLIEFC